MMRSSEFREIATYALRRTTQAPHDQRAHDESASHDEHDLPGVHSAIISTKETRIVVKLLLESAAISFSDISATKFQVVLRLFPSDHLKLGHILRTLQPATFRSFRAR